MYNTQVNWPPPGPLIDLLDALLPHLDTPTSDTPSEDCQERARHAVALVVCILGLPTSSNSDTKELSERICAKLDSILWWNAQIVIHKRKTSVTDAGNTFISFALTASRFSPVVRNALISLPSSVDLFALALAAPDIFEGFIRRSISYPCFVVFLSDLFESSESRGCLLDSIFRRGSAGIATFASNILELLGVLKRLIKAAISSDATMAAKLLEANAGILRHVVSDARFREALRKQKCTAGYLDCLTECLVSLPVNEPLAIRHAIEIYHWIETHYPRRERTSLILDFASRGGFSLLILAIQRHQETAMAERAVASILDYSSSQRIRKNLGGVFEAMESRFQPELDPRYYRLCRTYFPWTDWAISFERRLPPSEWSENEVSTSVCCNSLTVSSSLSSS